MSDPCVPPPQGEGDDDKEEEEEEEEVVVEEEGGDANDGVATNEPKGGEESSDSVSNTSGRDKPAGPVLPPELDIPRAPFSLSLHALGQPQETTKRSNSKRIEMTLDEHRNALETNATHLMPMIEHLLRTQVAFYRDEAKKLHAGAAQAKFKDNLQRLRKAIPAIAARPDRPPKVVFPLERMQKESEDQQEVLRETSEKLSQQFGGELREKQKLHDELRTRENMASRLEDLRQEVRRLRSQVEMKEIELARVQRDLDAHAFYTQNILNTLQRMDSQSATDTDQLLRVARTELEKGAEAVRRQLESKQGAEMSRNSSRLVVGLPRDRYKGHDWMIDDEDNGGLITTDGPTWDLNILEVLLDRLAEKLDQQRQRFPTVRHSARDALQRTLAHTDTLINRMTCPGCGNTLTHAVALWMCGHTYCRRCFEETLHVFGHVRCRLCSQIAAYYSPNSFVTRCCEYYDRAANHREEMRGSTAGLLRRTERDLLQSDPIINQLQ